MSLKNPMIFSQDYPLNILIAGNNADSRAATRDMLTGLGYQPGVATNTRELLDMTNIGSYDVILMDIQMPEAEAMLATQLSGGTKKRPLIIGITGSTKPGFKQICLQAGLDHSIYRPVDPKELRLQLKACSILSGNCRIRPAGC
ncbi:MAG TPA: response regulator [Puia sp.]|nr:response regulator [Puia sp.]